MIRFLRSLFCRHKYIWQEPVYDKISGYVGEIEQCFFCGKVHFLRDGYGIADEEKIKKLIKKYESICNFNRRKDN